MVLGKASGRALHCSPRQAFLSVLAAVLLVFFISTGSLRKLRESHLPPEIQGPWKAVVKQPQNVSWQKTAVWCPVGQIMSQFTRFPNLPWIQRRLFNCTRVFYNRVPKCASRTILTAFRLEADRTKCNYIAAERGMATNYFKNFTELASFPEEFMTYEAPLLYSRHLQFVNFSQFGFPMPVYINVIRDPVERFISHFYYHRYGSFSHHTGGAGNNTLHTKYTISNESLDECIEARGSACLHPFLNKVLPFFCGHSRFCNRGGSAAHLKKVKQVVRDHYLVVGLTEDLPAFMEVLENLLPRMFPNVTQSFQKVAFQAQQKFKTVSKPEVSDKSREVIKDTLSKEYDFYYFIKQRFYRLLERVRKAWDFEQADDMWIS